MKTSFSRWLERRDLTPWRYATTRQLSIHAIYFLAGVARSRPSGPSSHIMASVSEETGISMKRLYEEGMAAREAGAQAEARHGVEQGREGSGL